MQGLAPYVDVPETSFSEVFAASLGQVIDEGLSISSTLNREGWTDRRKQVSDLIGAGTIDREKYTNRRGRFDYDRLASDTGAIKTDSQLRDERNAILAQRREYAQDVIERGSGMAQFLGAANAYMLDPISIVTMPIATAATAGKSLSIIGRALITARNAAAIEASIELAIQPLVYEHKQDIESPFSELDAITNIATAAIGGGVLGGVAGGLAGYFQKVRKAAQQLPQTDEVIQSTEYLQRMEEVVDSAEVPEISKVSDDNPFLFDVDPKALTKTETDFKDVEAFKVDPSKDAKKPIVTAYVNGELRILDGHHRTKIALEGDKKIRMFVLPEEEFLKMEKAGIHQGEMFKEFAAKGEGIKRAAPAMDMERYRIDQETKYLQQLDQQRAVSGTQSRTQAQYAEPEQPKPVSAKKIERQGDILDSAGMREDFDRSMAEFEKLDSPMIPDDANNLVDAKAFMKELDDELDGLDSVLVCTRG